MNFRCYYFGGLNGLKVIPIYLDQKDRRFHSRTAKKLGAHFKQFFKNVQNFYLSAHQIPRESFCAQFFKPKNTYHTKFKLAVQVPNWHKLCYFSRCVDCSALFDLGHIRWVYNHAFKHNPLISGKSTTRHSLENRPENACLNL